MHRHEMGERAHPSTLAYSEASVEKTLMPCIRIDILEGERSSKVTKK